MMTNDESYHGNEKLIKRKSITNNHTVILDNQYHIIKRPTFVLVAAAPRYSRLFSP